MSEKPILYLSMVSPACRAVIMVGAELDVEFDVKDIDLSAGEHKKVDFLKVSHI